MVKHEKAFCKIQIGTDQVMRGREKAK